MNRKIYRICLVALILAITVSSVWCYQIWQEQQTVVMDGDLV